MDGIEDAAGRTNPENQRARKKLYERMRRHNLAPLWEVLHDILRPAPASPCAPALWRYTEMRPYLLEAGNTISAAEAQRRVLVLENPQLPGQSRITRSLYAGLQIVMPGEIAPAHRHVAAALRLIVEGGPGAYTAVDGERTAMASGDFIITPSWTWHDHGNESDRPVVWLDGLDLHIVNLFEAGFYEQWPEERYPTTRPAGSCLAEIGAGLLPVDDGGGGHASLLLSYPYARSREALDSLARHQAPDECHGFKMKFLNPLNGGWALPTIATCMQLLPKGFHSVPYRSTATTVFAVVEGSGSTLVGAERLDWQRHDVLVVPSWVPHEHIAATEAVVFSFSDRAAQERLAIYREQRGPRRS